VTRSAFPLFSFAPVALFLTVVAASSAAQAQIDQDADLVEYALDNCSLSANGPNQSTDQVDSDLDGYGNRCDADYNNDFATTAVDFGRFLECFGFGINSGWLPGCEETDHDGNSATSPGDFGLFLNKFTGAGTANRPGPTGLWCAGDAPCKVYFRRTQFSATNTPGLPNDVTSPTDYDVVTFRVPPGRGTAVVGFQMIAGAPGGLCAGGVHCYADGSYALAGWADLADAEANPTTGTLFHYAIDGDSVQVFNAGTTNGGVPGNPTFPMSRLIFPMPIGLGLTLCPAAGCVVGLISDVSAAPGLVVETRTASFVPAGTPVDHALCPVGCEGGLPVATAAIELIAAPTLP